MGTNFYARVIPTKERKDKLKELIDSDAFDEIQSYVSDTYGRFEAMSMDEKPHGVIHLGKRSGGWKFLWDPNMFIIRNGHLVETKRDDGSTSCRYERDPDTVYYTYPLTKKGIKEFIDREDIEVFDEYGEKQDKDVFFKEALEWTKWRDRETGEETEAYDAALYEKDNPDEKKFVLNTDYTRMIASEGFVFTSSTNSDFYSDGLRFASFTDFS